MSLFFFKHYIENEWVGRKELVNEDTTDENLCVWYRFIRGILININNSQSIHQV